MNIKQIVKEEESRILKQEFSFLKEDLGIVAWTAMFGMFAVPLINNRADKYIKKGKTLCDRYDGNKKTKCLQDVKKVVSERKLQQLIKGKRICKKIDDPVKREKCQEKYNNQIKNTKKDIKESRRFGGLTQPNGTMYDSYGDRGYHDK